MYDFCKYNWLCLNLAWSWDSIVSIVSSYGLDSSEFESAQG